MVEAGGSQVNYTFSLRPACTRPCTCSDLPGGVLGTKSGLLEQCIRLSSDLSLQPTNAQAALIVCLFVCLDSVSVHYVDKANLEHRDPPTSTRQVLA